MLAIIRLANEDEEAAAPRWSGGLDYIYAQLSQRGSRAAGQRYPRMLVGCEGFGDAFG